jgi:hypothetical protein
MFGKISSLFAKYVTSTRIESLVPVAEPPKEKKLTVSQEPYQFIPGDWYRTTGPFSLYPHMNTTVTYSRYSAVKRELLHGKIPSAPKGVYRNLSVERKTDILLINTETFDVEYEADTFVRLRLLHFLVEDKMFSYTAGYPGYPNYSQLKKLANNWTDPVYHMFRPSRFYPNFRRTMYDEGNPRKRSGANLAGLTGQIRL